MTSKIMRATIDAELIDILHHATRVLNTKHARVVEDALMAYFFKLFFNKEFDKALAKFDSCNNYKARDARYSFKEIQMFIEKRKQQNSLLMDI